MEFSEAGYHFIIKTARKERSFCEKSKGFEFLRRNTYESKKALGVLLAGLLAAGALAGGSNGTSNSSAPESGSDSQGSSTAES